LPGCALRAPYDERTRIPLHEPLAARVSLARMLMFVPGNRPERFDKAARCGADVVVPP
jgi:hypothetical protein